MEQAEIIDTFGTYQRATSLRSITLGGPNGSVVVAARWRAVDATHVVGKSRQMSEELNLTWDLCCEAISWRESTLTRDSTIYPGFSPSFSRGKILLLLPLIMSFDSRKNSRFS